jgi:hypothetical protein
MCRRAELVLAVSTGPFRFPYDSVESLSILSIQFDLPHQEAYSRDRKSRHPHLVKPPIERKNVDMGERFNDPYRILTEDGFAGAS